MTQDNFEKLFKTEVAGVLDMENNISDMMSWSDQPELNDSFPTMDMEIITFCFPNVIVTS